MPLSTHIPRLVIAGISSGVGKTTTMVGLAQALRLKGLRVAVFKCGPDYLDPGYHARAAQRPSHNLDGWMMGREAVIATFVRASQGADIALVEGMMGLFDGASPVSDEGSTAQIAKWLRAPVLVVVDASGMARTAAAVAAGVAIFDREVSFAGLICNRVGSRGHLDLLRQAVSASPVVGGFTSEPERCFPERHLGLLSADERTLPDDLLAAWGKLASDWLDLEKILAIAGSAPELSETFALPHKASAKSRCKIGIAFDEAFHFYYDDNLHQLESSGAELVKFSPIHDAHLPDVDGIYLGGGYPEVHAEALAANRLLIEEIRNLAARGAPVYAECGGLMYLCRAIRTLDGHEYSMAGLIPGEVVMFEKLQALGYAEVETLNRSPLGPSGLRFRGHQFRYSELRLDESTRTVERIYSVKRQWSEPTLEGYRVGNVVASYIHAHWASNRQIAEELVRSCAKVAGSKL